jgi:histidine triad (HIT) family protein
MASRTLLLSHNPPSAPRGFNPTLQHNQPFMTEVGKAPAPKSEYDPANPFAKMLRKEIPTEPVFEDDKCLVIKDISPQAPVHLLVLPKAEISQVSKASAEHAAIMGHCLYVAGQEANKAGMGETGFRLVVNDGKQGCQSVYHMHIHVIGGRQMEWPPG